MENLFLKAFRSLFAKSDAAFPRNPQGPSPVEEFAMTDLPSERFENVPSPFCGIASDDLTLEVRGLEVRVVANGDPVTHRGFEAPITDQSPRIQGLEVSLDAAVAHAADLLKASHLPVFSGFGTDVNETRAAFSLIDRSRGVFDQVNAKAGLRNLLVLADSGWMSTTLAELKNRADVLVLFGTDPEGPFPRFFERFVWPEETLFGQDASKRQLIFLGRAPSGSAAKAPDGREPEVHICDPEAYPLIAGALAALANGVDLKGDSVGGISMAVLKSIIDRLKAAQYGVVSWAAGQLDFDHAELTLQRLTKAIVALNATTRCAALPLGGQDGDRTASQVSAWLSGYPTRVSYQKGYPDYDPYHHSAERLLNRGEADLLVWVSSLSPAPPPEAKVPTVVIGRSGMTFTQEPEVFIPVGVPGIDFAGHMYRCDNVVALPLYQIRKSELPRASAVLKAVETAMDAP
jgi:formylmethanofuran dehydrogenase subunit B